MTAAMSQIAGSEGELRHALRTSKKVLQSEINKHWLGRLAIAVWILNTSLIGFLAPTTLLGHALDMAGPSGFVFMFVLSAQASIALVDSVINGVFPTRYTVCMRNQRHVGFMLMASMLVIAGAGMVQATHAPPVVMTAFVLPALLCVVVTVCDLRLRHMERQ